MLLLIFSCNTLMCKGKLKSREKRLASVFFGEFWTKITSTDGRNQVERVTMNLDICNISNGVGLVNYIGNDWLNKTDIGFSEWTISTRFGSQLRIQNLADIWICSNLSVSICICWHGFINSKRSMFSKKSWGVTTQCAEPYFLPSPLVSFIKIFIEIFIDIYIEIFIEISS